jgi:hypothetical protein
MFKSLKIETNMRNKRRKKIKLLKVAMSSGSPLYLSLLFPQAL